MNVVLLTGKLTRDPELRELASGKAITQFTIATAGVAQTEYHSIVVWDRLAQVCAQYLCSGMVVAIHGRLQTREWQDDRGVRHWKAEVIADDVQLVSGRHATEMRDAAHAAAIP